jgi:hypothetical protein
MMAMLAGCSTSPEPGITAKINKLETEVRAEPERTTRAANEVLQEMDLFVISSTSTNLDGRVIARSGTDRRLTVDISNVGDNRSHVSLKGAGNIFRDSGLGVSILNRIKDRVEGAQNEPMEEEVGGTGQPDAATPGETLMSR